MGGKGKERRWEMLVMCNGLDEIAKSQSLTSASKEKMVIQDTENEVVIGDESVGTTEFHKG